MAKNPKPLQFTGGPESRMPPLANREPGFTSDTLRMYVGSPYGNIGLAKKEEIEGVSHRVDALETGKADQSTVNELSASMAQNTKKIGISALDPRFGAKGDGVTDDTNALWGVHNYANTNNLPVFYPPVTFALTQPTKNIFIKTNTDFGKAKFIIDEQYNTTTPRFQINSLSTRTTLSDELNKLGGGVVTIEASQKAAILAKLQKKEYIIPELAQYKGNYLIVVDDNDKIGKRQGANENEGFERTDMFVIEEGGRRYITELHKLHAHDYSNR